MASSISFPYLSFSFEIYVLLSIRMKEDAFFSKDYVEIRDGGLEVAPLVGRYVQ